MDGRVRRSGKLFLRGFGKKIMNREGWKRILGGFSPSRVMILRRFSFTLFSVYAVPFETLYLEVPSINMNSMNRNGRNASPTVKTFMHCKLFAPAYFNPRDDNVRIYRLKHYLNPYNLMKYTFLHLSVFHFHVLILKLRKVIVFFIINNVKLNNYL